MTNYQEKFYKELHYTFITFCVIFFAIVSIFALSHMLTVIDWEYSIESGWTWGTEEEWIKLQADYNGKYGKNGWRGSFIPRSRADGNDCIETFVPERITLFRAMYLNYDQWSLKTIMIGSDRYMG